MTGTTQGGWKTGLGSDPRPRAAVFRHFSELVPGRFAWRSPSPCDLSLLPMHPPNKSAHYHDKRHVNSADRNHEKKIKIHDGIVGSIILFSVILALTVNVGVGST